ncbi:MAG: reverse transcriptase/maturase family protein [Candidatus Omnitrophota bacterium]
MIDNIFDTIIHPQNLYRAAYAAALGKKSSVDVAAFFFRMERQIVQLYEELRSGKYRHGSYTVFKIYEPKPRDISKALFRDRVVHHAVHDVIEPFIDKKFIFDSYACRHGKGTHAALKRAQSFLRAQDYCMHGDIRKYFPSINHAVLKGLLRRHISDGKLLVLLDHIIDTARDEAGLPIGNLTSQFFANLYLHELDHFVKYTLRCRYYIRYMDDFLLFDNDNAVLERWRGMIEEMLVSRLKLQLHPDKTRIFPVRKGMTFLGFRSFRERCRVAAQGMKRMRARMKKFRYLTEQKEITEPEIAASVQCWVAHSRTANSARLRSKMAKETATWSAGVSRIFGW